MVVFSAVLAQLLIMINYISIKISECIFATVNNTLID